MSSSRQPKSGKRRHAKKKAGARSEPPPLYDASVLYELKRGRLKTFRLRVLIRRLDQPFPEWSEWGCLSIPRRWRDLLDLDEPDRTQEWARRERAFLADVAPTKDHEQRAHRSWLAKLLDSFEAGNTEIRIGSESEALTDPEQDWTIEAEAYVLDRVRDAGGTFRTPPPDPGGWVYGDGPETAFARTPIWPKGKEPAWDGLAEGILCEIDLGRRASAHGWHERARYHERRAAEALTMLRYWNDARTGRLVIQGGRHGSAATNLRRAFRPSDGRRGNSTRCGYLLGTASSPRWTARSPALAAAASGGRGTSV
jgi:hypothetical protein